jgi:transcriptional regulator with AAA-type ATPase domain
MENTRNIAITKLDAFFRNPGYFSILVLGENGTGKEYVIKDILTRILTEQKVPIQDNELESKPVQRMRFFYPFEIGETETEISEIFDYEFIVLKNVEELSNKQQNLLLQALSTIDGKVGFSDKRAYRRIAFTSTYDADVLREQEGEFRLVSRFWDRISQLVVKIPSFKEYGSDILSDFESVWKKMSFTEHPKLPQDGDFQYWLKKNCKTFSGNFRDLDKIAILWHQYRIIEYQEKLQKFKSELEAKIFSKVRSDFEGLSHFPTQKADLTNIFEFENNKSWEQIDRDFRSKFKVWAKKTHGSIINATKELNMPSRKMDKW